MPSKSRKWVSRSDFALIFSLPGYMFLSWFVHEPWWNGICRVMNRFSRIFSSPNPLVEKVALLLPSTMMDVDPAAIVQELEEGRREHYFQVFRDYRPRGWNTVFEINGIHHLEEARQSKRGVILWIDHFVFNGLLPKKVLAQAGYRFTHLSRPEHGFSKTEFGVRILNPLRTSIEDRYLKGRVLIERGAESRSVRSLTRLLKQGEIASITAGAWEGRRTARAKVLGHDYPLATGAPAIAHSTDSSLIPVAVYRLPHSGKFRVDLDSPILLGSVETKSEAIEVALAAYARHLEPLVKAYPGQWRGWNYLEVRS